MLGNVLLQVYGHWPIAQTLMAWDWESVPNLYQMMMSYFKGTADAVAEYCSAVNCPNAPNTF